MPVSADVLFRLVFAAALLNNVLVHLFYVRLKGLVARQPLVLSIDMAFAAAFIALTGGTSSPYYLYALNSLLAAAFLFQIGGGLIAASVLTLFYVLALGIARRLAFYQTGDTSDVLEASTRVLIFFLVGVIFGYPSILLRRARKASAKLRRLRKRFVHSRSLIAVGQRTAQASHEIRNPLSTMGAFAHSILRKPDDVERVKAKARVIADEAERLESLLTEMLDLSHPPKLNLRPQNIEEILDRACVLSSGEIIKSGVPIAIEKDYGADLPWIPGDACSLLRAFLNVMRNAIHAMPQGGTLTVTTWCADNGVEVIIADTGCGIPRHLLPSIFSPFTSHRENGTGLGLSVTHQIIRAHEGRITVDSEEGKGTWFRFYLPARLPERNGQMTEDIGDE
jgi:signal transduction histidine kinase